MLVCGIFLGLIACLEIGYRLADRRPQDPGSRHEGIGGIETAVFALLGLLMGFSFAGGMSRLETRRDLVVRAANAIGTAYLRLDLLADNDQIELRRLFREYIDAQIRVPRLLPDLDAAGRELEAAKALERRIWSKAVAATPREPDQNAAKLLLLPALNEMIDLTTARSVMALVRVPTLILVLLVSVALLSGVLAGYAIEKRHKRSILHMLAYAVVVAITIYAIIDLDNPRSGLIRLDAADKALTDLRESIH
jgi:hypothetical protein